MAITNTARAGLTKDGTTENYSVVRVNANSDLIDELLGCTPCLSSARPTTALFPGRLAYETDTEAVIVYRDVTGWRYVQTPLVDSQAERDALVFKNDGLKCYRRDRDWFELWDGGAWRVQGIAVCSTTTDRDTAITNPYDGQFAFVTAHRGLYRYGGGVWNDAATRGIEGSVVRTATDTNASTSETLIDSKTITAVNGRSYCLKLISNLLISGGTSPAGFTVRFRWATGASVSNTDNFIEGINDFISTGSFQHYRNYEQTIDWGGATGQVTFGVFALALGPMSQLRFTGTANGKREFRVVDEGLF